jgi:hypothetical protein
VRLAVPTGLAVSDGPAGLAAVALPAGFPLPPGVPLGAPFDPEQAAASSAVTARTDPSAIGPRRRQPGARSRLAVPVSPGAVNVPYTPLSIGVSMVLA